MPREERYRNFLECLNKNVKIVVGTRSAVFAPIDGLTTIIIYKESSSDHYETRSPGWNSKDVAKRRAKMEDLSVIYLGYCPSIEIANSIDNVEVLFEFHQSSVNVAAFNPDSGTLLPGRIFPEISTGILPVDGDNSEPLRKDVIIDIAPEQGYSGSSVIGY
jgi:hypothetical protein